MSIIKAESLQRAAQLSSFFSGFILTCVHNYSNFNVIIMVQIVGKYQYTSAENFEEFMKYFTKNEIQDTLFHSKPLIEIQQKGEQWFIIVTNQGKSISTASFKLGETYDELLPIIGTTLKSITTEEGDKIKTESSLGTDMFTRLYEFTDTEMIVHITSNKTDIVAKRIYKRL